MVYFWSSTFRIKRTKVPLLLEAICYSDETGQKSSGLKCLRKFWSSKLPHTIPSQLIKLSKNRQFLKVLVLNEQSFINYFTEKKDVVKDGKQEGRNLSLNPGLP